MEGYDWFSGFMRRYPDLSIQKSDGLSVAPEDSPERNLTFYNLLVVQIQAYNLQNKPENIANVGESEVQLINSAEKVIAAYWPSNITILTGSFNQVGLEYKAACVRNTASLFFLLIGI